MTTHPVPTPSADELVKRQAWPEKTRAAVSALEDQYAISVCSEEHLIEWVDRCERLEAEATKAAARILALESQLARMDEALRPFEKLFYAAMRDKYFGSEPDTAIFYCEDGETHQDDVSITKGDLRRAAEALSSTPVQAD